MPKLAMSKSCEDHDQKWDVVKNQREHVWCILKFWTCQTVLGGSKMYPYDPLLHARFSKQSRADRTVPINATIIQFSRTSHKYAQIRFRIGSIKIVARPMGYHLVIKLGNGKSPIEWRFIAGTIIYKLRIFNCRV